MSSLDTTSRCPSSEQLAALAEGAVRGAERSELLAHIQTCAACFDSYSLALESLTEPVASQAPARRGNPWWAGLAAAAVVVAALVLSRISEQRPPGPGALWTARMATVRGAPTAVAAELVLDGWPESTVGHAFAPDSPSAAFRLYGVRLADVDWSRRYAPRALEGAVDRARRLLDGWASDEARRLRAALPDASEGRASEGDALAPDDPQQRDAAALGWLLEWCRLAARAGRHELCTEFRAELVAAVERGLQDPAARRLWREYKSLPPEADDATRERLLRRLLEVLT